MYSSATKCQSCVPAFVVMLTDIAGAESVFGRKRVAGYLDLVRVLRSRNVQDSSPALGNVIAALQKEQVVPKIAASEIQEGVILVGRVFTATRPQQLPVTLRVHGGIQRHKGKHVSQIERKLLNLLALELGADVGVLGLKQRPTRVDRDLLGCADGQSDTFRYRIARGQDNPVLPCGLEPRGGDLRV